MSRPLKDGVDYFPFDVDFFTDDKTRMLRQAFGSKGLILLIYLLCKIYNDNGYYMRWDETACYLASDGAGCGLSPNVVEEIVKGCVKRGFFDESVFNLFGVLSSAGIQRRFVRMLKNRDTFTFIKEYFLLDVSDKKDVPDGILNKLAFKSLKRTENPDKSSENPDKSSENALKEKEKEREKEIKLNKNKNKLAAVVKFYQDNICPITPIVAQGIEHWLDDVDESLIMYAIEQAAANNKRTWKYVEAIIKNHFNAGRKTRQEAEVVKPVKNGKNEDKYDFDKLERLAFEAINKRDECRELEKSLFED